MGVNFLMCRSTGSTVTFITGDGKDVMCCGEEMVKLDPKDTDGTAEKHVPKIDRNEGTVRVDVGEIAHPMDDHHFIEWIYLETKRGGQFVKLKSGEAPRATFGVSGEEPGDEPVAVYAYCNEHGLWKTEL